MVSGYPRCMAFTCRLSPDLHERAVAHARRVGIPLSSLVSIALDAYLGGRTEPVAASEPVPQSSPGKNAAKRVAAVPDPLAGLSPAQRLAEHKRLERIDRLKKGKR